MTQLPSLKSLQELVFEAPLYAVFQTPEGKFEKQDNLEGHCPWCNKSSIFKRLGNLTINRNVTTAASTDFHIRCVRNEQHVIRTNVITLEQTIQKVGQFPSFASIANDATKPYRSLLSQPDGSELHKAIGLASHGVGIGSFVYIRRIFERLIRKRFDEVKEINGWQEDDYSRRRMDERIELLKQHLPEFLVTNRKLYSILSLGIHELDEAECLAFFEVARTSITFILDEDRRRKDEEAERLEAQKAIAAYRPQSKS